MWEKTFESDDVVLDTQQQIVAILSKIKVNSGVNFKMSIIVFISTFWSLLEVTRISTTYNRTFPWNKGSVMSGAAECFWEGSFES